MAQDYALGESIEIQRRLYKVDRYYQWIFETVEPFIGDRVLEVGCGLGHFTELLLSRSRVASVDISRIYAQVVAQKYGTLHNFSSHVYDILDPAILSLGREQFDTLICLNLLEHVEDDEKALFHMRELLSDGGRLVLLVPALKSLYGEMDRADHHFRRYARQEVLAKVRAAGFAVEKAFYFNFLGTFGWFLNGRLLKRKLLPEVQVSLFNRLVPFLARFESFFNVPFGQSVIVVGVRD